MNKKDEAFRNLDKATEYGYGSFKEILENEDFEHKTPDQHCPIFLMSKGLEV